MLLLDDRLVLSPSDLRLAAACEFAALRELDVTLGRASALPMSDDAMGERVRRLGDEHEQAELRRLVRAHPGGVRQLPRPGYDRTALAAAHAETLALLRDDATEVVYQATCYDGGFLGFADFLERTDAGWLVCDTKLARSESVAALLQVSAYAAMLTEAGVPTAPTARLLLGSGESRDHALADLVPAYRARRSRLESLRREHRSEEGPVQWGDPRWLACGRCETCTSEAEAAHDVILVAGLRMPTRRRLVEAGVRTLEQLAERREPVPDVRTGMLERLRAQAALQLQQERDGVVRAEVIGPEALALLPPPSEGDVFFDFEGDPLWVERGSDDWGLEYLFGFVTLDGGTDEPRFDALWAHDREQEKAALAEFVAWLTARREQWPDLHVYHYASYETTALLRLAVRHGVCEEEVDQLLRDGVFVDLYAAVRAGVRVSQRSYSIKKLEPLYMPARSGEVQAADASIVAYHEFMAAMDEEASERAQGHLDDIADYNRDDCISTLRLRDWLLEQAASVGVHPGGPPGSLSSSSGGSSSSEGSGGAPTAPTMVQRPALSDKRRAAVELEQALRGRLEGVARGERTAEERALAMVAAAVQFHTREAKPYWWRWFERLRLPVRDWGRDADAFVVERVEVVDGWRKQTPRQRPRRTLRLWGEPGVETAFGAGDTCKAIYVAPFPSGVEASGPGMLNAASSASVEVLDATLVTDAAGRPQQLLTVRELQPKGGDGHDATPVALVRGDQVRADRVEGALAELARDVLAADVLPEQPALDVLRRRPPRLRSGGALPEVGEGPRRHIEAITAAVLDLDRSYLAVQGPPGTGKTYVGAHVVAELVARGWRVGVSAQSHAAIENVLTAVVAAGVPGERVAKLAKVTPEPTWTPLRAADDLAGFAAEQAGGYVIGGTAWDLCHEGRVERGQLDLLVIDEAGQFSLAMTLAVSLSATRLLLLGDPQQLPQVSTGTHPEPVDDSALGWVIGDEAVLPSSHGYFLETTWRMHPRLTEPVSRLAYAGQLRSNAQVTQVRDLEGVRPGLHVRLVDHHDNATRSPEEAQAVVALAQDLLGRHWRTSTEDPGRALEQGDLLVITPYNAQVTLLRRALDDAGLSEVPVGTVDTVQGREAPVAIVSMAASAHADVSRGMGFLLDRHRLNVAVSRGQWAAYLVHSSVLADFGPRSPGELTALGAFLGLGEQAVSSESSSRA